AFSRARDSPMATKERVTCSSQSGLRLRRRRECVCGSRIDRGVESRMTIVGITVGAHAVHIGLIGAPALLLLGLRAAGRHMRSNDATPGSDSATLRTRAFPITLAALSASAGLLHATVIREHFTEYWLFGAFFIVAASLQLVWAMVVLRRVGRNVLV